MAKKERQAKPVPAAKGLRGASEEDIIAAQLRMVDEAKEREKPVMIAARVHPKLQYGLRLLSRVQGGTIAEAMEWAIRLAMRRTGIGSKHAATTLDVVVDRVWSKPTEAQQIYELFSNSPELLNFDERSAWGLVRRCKDLWRMAFYKNVYEYFSDDNGNTVEGVIDQAECLENDPERIDFLDDRVPIFDLIEKNWDAIKRVGILLARNGEIDNFYTLEEIKTGEALKKSGISSD